MTARTGPDKSSAGAGARTLALDPIWASKCSSLTPSRFRPRADPIRGGLRDPFPANLHADTTAANKPTYHPISQPQLSMQVYAYLRTSTTQDTYIMHRRHRQSEIRLNRYSTLTPPNPPTFFPPPHLPTSISSLIHHNHPQRRTNKTKGTQPRSPLNETHIPTSSLLPMDAFEKPPVTFLSFKKTREKKEQDKMANG